MEACMANLVEPGDTVLIGCNGYFGLRLADMAERYGGKVQKLVKAWGEVFTREEIEAGLKEHKPTLLCLVHAETSTGACQRYHCLASVFYLRADWLWFTVFQSKFLAFLDKSLT